MRALQITPEAPGRFSGGKIGVRQTLLSLVGNGYQVDYVGPEIEDDELKSLYSTVYILEPGNNVLLRIYDTLHHNTNKRYRSWLKLELDLENYDAIIMDFTKLDYVLDKIPGERVVVRVHNVESDYSLKNYLYHKSIFNYLDKVFSGIREKRIVHEVSKLAVLTEKDKKRLKELYTVPDEKMAIVPVCIPGKNNQVALASKDDTVNMILAGSLWFGPNYEGIKWFLEAVYTKLTIPKKVIIAGSRPNDELKEMIKKFADVVLVDSPEIMEPYFLQADLAIAPVFDGAGMKVKVAEALSYGLPVLGTGHAFEGYSIQHGVNSYCGDTAEEFAECIYHFYQLNVEKRLKMKEESRKLFDECYSQEKSNELFGNLLK